MPEIAISAVTTVLTTVGVPGTIASTIATVAVNAGMYALSNAAMGCCAPMRCEGAGAWAEEGA